MSVKDPNLSSSGQERVDEIKYAMVQMEAVIELNCPDGRRKALALTHLETAALFAVKSVFEP